MVQMIGTTPAIGLRFEWPNTNPIPLMRPWYLTRERLNSNTRRISRPVSQPDQNSAGLEEGALTRAMAQPEVLKGLAQRGWVPVSDGYIAEAELSTAEPLMLQKGIQRPEGLPAEVPVVVADETTVAGMLNFLRGWAAQGGYNAIFSMEHFDLKDAQAAIPLSQPMPGSVLLAPGAPIHAKQLGAALVISKQTGTIYVVHITEFTSPNWEKPLLHVRTQA